MNRIVLAALIVSLVFSGTAVALNPGGRTVLIPIVSRLPGGLGTSWRTDLFVANFGSVTRTATVTYYVAGGATQQTSITLTPYSCAAMPDVVLNTFGMSTGSGQVQISSGDGATLQARARIYNVGNSAGEFGQAVQGIGNEWLSRQAYLHGLSGIGGNRVNIGVANPNGTATTITIQVLDSAGVELYRGNDTVGAYQTVQYNDIFARFSIAPRDNIQVQVWAPELPIYGYASEVRADTGDANFTFGTNPNM